MTIKTRLEKLEKQHGAKDTEFIIVYMDNGKVSDRHGGGKHPELIGKTEAELDALYSGREDVQVIEIIYARQAENE